MSRIAQNVQKFLKAHVALVGGALAWYLATYPNGADVRYVSAAVAVLTALGVAVVPNKTEDTVLSAAVHEFPDPAVRGNTA